MDVNDGNQINSKFLRSFIRFDRTNANNKASWACYSFSFCCKLLYQQGTCVTCPSAEASHSDYQALASSTRCKPLSDPVRRSCFDSSMTSAYLGIIPNFLNEWYFLVKKRKINEWLKINCIIFKIFTCSSSGVSRPAAAIPAPDVHYGQTRNQHGYGDAHTHIQRGIVCVYSWLGWKKNSE